MSDLSAGQPVAEPVGPPPGPAPTDTAAIPDASGDTAPSRTGPRSTGAGVKEAVAPGADASGAPRAEPESESTPAAGEATGDGDGGRVAGANPRRRRRRPSSGQGPSGPGPSGPGSEAAGPRTPAAPGEPETGEGGVDASGVGPPAGRRPSSPGAERPRIGDTRPAPAPAPVPVVASPRPARRSQGGPKGGGTREAGATREVAAAGAGDGPAGTSAATDEGDDGTRTAAGRSRRRSGRERRGRPVGRYLMCVHVRPHATQIAVLEGRTLVEHQVSRAADDATQIDGNIYRGRVQNVLPGMEAAFVDIGTPKNAVLYRGDVRYDRDDVETSGSSGGGGGGPRIEQMLRAGQTILCQVTKNPIGAKGARLTQEVSLPGRFVVMVPNSSAFGISKRLDDAERKRLRRIVDDVRPKGHGLIVRTAAEGASQEELGHDVERLTAQWAAIEAEAGRSQAPGLLYREPDLAVRSVREEFNREYRGVVIDDEELYNEVRDYIEHVNPELADRVELYDPVAENMPVFERFHVHEQLHKALDRKVWLPSGGSIIIERTEALTVIDVNTGKNVGTSNLEETVYRNNLEAAEEIARQLRLRDIGGIIVIDFIDMEIRENRDKVASALRSALARDKTRTQVFDISELGLIEMTRKRVSEGLVESLSSTCAICGGRGIVLDETLL
jgi:ribonuclease E